MMRRSVVDHVNRAHPETIVIIGASTGGPRALEQILTKLPRHFKPAIFIVQHLPQHFTKTLAERLNTISDIHVTEASQGDIIRSGTAYIAPGNTHMRIRDTGSSHSIELSDQPAQSRHKPSVNVLCESVSDIASVNKLVVILTGMGNDGSEGITTIKQQDKHAFVLAQSQASSVVYGMPKAAVMTNHVDEVVELTDIAEKLISLAEDPRGK